MIDFKKKYNTILKQYFVNSYWNFNLKLTLFFVIFVLIVLDFTFKSLVVANLKEGEEVNFLPGFIQIKLVYNSGAAFGMGATNPKLMLGLQLFLTFIITLIWFFLKKPIYIINLSITLGGALGNILDRFGNNRSDWGVIDYFSWELFPPYSIFNFADMLVVVSIISLVISCIIYSYKEYQEDKNE